MSKDVVYENYLGKIAEVLCVPCVEENDEMISAYSLYEIINKRFEALRGIYNCKDLINNINMLLDNRKKRTIIDVLRGRKKLQCIGINPYMISKDKLEIEFLFNDNSSVIIRREIGNGKIEAIDDNNALQEIFKVCFKDINNIFDVLEDYYLLFASDKHPIIKKYGLGEYFSQPISSDLEFCIDILYGLSGRVAIDIDNSLHNYFDDIQSAQNKKRIISTLYEQFPEILMRIPISISQLNPVCRRIVEDSKKAKKRVLS